MTSYEGQPPGEGSTETERASRMPFVEMLETRQRAANSLLCVGLDPVIESMSDSFISFLTGELFDNNSPVENVTHQHELLLQAGKTEEAGMLINSRILEEFDKIIINQTHEFVCAFKLNIAFYLRYGEYGLAALRRVIGYIREVDQTIPVILDSKNADIGATNKGYAEMVSIAMEADAITVNPYFGIEGAGALDPFLELENTGAIVLCRTSNP